MSYDSKLNSEEKQKQRFKFTNNKQNPETNITNPFW